MAMTAERAEARHGHRPEESSQHHSTESPAERSRKYAQQCAAYEGLLSDMRLQLARGRFKWIRLVTATPDLPDGLKLLLVTIALHMSDKKYRAWPSQMELAKAINKSDRQVRRLIKDAENLNWLDVDHNSGGSFNQDREQRGNTDTYYLKLPTHLLGLLHTDFPNPLDGNF